MRSPVRMPEMASVLIVEDEDVLRITFEEFLRDDGHEVRAAADYDTAIDLLTDAPADVVVTDIILSGRTGVDLLRTIRERGINSPVIMITGEPNVETAAEGIRLGAFDYLSKPVTGPELKRIVRFAIDRHALRAERDRYAEEVDEIRRALEATFNSVQEGILVVDPEMNVRQLNHAAEALLSTSVGVVLKKPFAQLVQGGWKDASDALAETLKSRKATFDRQSVIEVAGQRKVFRFNATPLVDGEETFTGAILVIRDYTRLDQLEKQVESRSLYRNIIGRSREMRDIFDLVRDLAETDSTVLICGESGTGKELVAAALHESSPRSTGPFIKVNCAALSEDILESELFGHVKGAFTGAIKDRIGRFEAASGGTILLDEIGDISPRLQLRLLRVLQEHEFERVGDTASLKVDVRVIASTNQDLAAKIKDGTFRQDLYYRLNVVRIEIPPLRERPADLPPLIEYFCRRFNAQFRRDIDGVTQEAEEILRAHSWEGNVRELENCIERAFVVCHDRTIRPEHLPPEIRTAVQTTRGESLHTEGLDETAERERIVEVLTRSDWNVAKCARLLGIARNTLYQKMKQMDIERPPEQA